MESRNYSDYSLQELYGLYNSLDKENNPAEAEYVFEWILKKEKEEPRARKLASRGSRLGANLIDDFIMGIPAAITILIILLSLDFQSLMQNNLQYLKEQFLTMFIYSILVTQIAYLSFNGWLLFKHGQTIGKKLLGIKIVDLENDNPGLTTLYLLRYLIPSIFNSIPLIGGIFGLVNHLFIFREDRRCLHDLMAGTKVVMAE